MVKTLYLIRHGETIGGNEKRYKGSLDVPLSERGIEQVKRTAQVLRDASFSAIYTSPLARALKSAEIIAEDLRLTPIVLQGLRERSFGIWEGMTFLEIKEKYPEEFENWANNPLKFSPPEGESTLQVKDRVVKVLEDILNKEDGSVAVVAHGGVNRIILCYLMGIPLENIFRIEQDFAAINIIEFHEKYPVVKLLNFKPWI